MLHKRFKPAKCKTSLRLATSRIKLMKNKKGVQITQIKKDLAQLLESGQDRTARIRVEHVIREEKMVAAYDLIEIYCELIIARLPIIESQKTCPLDLKEAITSVIFAAPRCSDIPELLDVRKQFTAKYGKEFISAAIELRPDCGVSRLLVEKLSAVAPDVQTKMKVLSAVAKEHNIDWDSTSFEEKESKPPDDVLQNGPTNFVKVNIADAEGPMTQESNAPTVPSHQEKQNTSFDFSQQNRRYTTGGQNNGIEASSSSHADMRSSGVTSERKNPMLSFRNDSNDISQGRQNWDMEFKDATSAAQAAAESAERASMAARAAAQLSNHERISRQYSTESHESNVRDSEFPGPRHSRDSHNVSLNDRKPNSIQNQQMGLSEHDTSPKASRLGPLSSNNGPIEEDRPVTNLHRADGDFQGSSYSEMGAKKEFKESKTEPKSGRKESFKSEDFNYFAEEVFKKQPSISSSRVHSTTVGDEPDESTSDQQKFRQRTGVGNPFAVVDQGYSFRESTNVDAPRDDGVNSDNDGPIFDMGSEYSEDEDKQYSQSPDGQSRIRQVENTHIWSPRRNSSDTVDQVSSRSHLFSEQPAKSGDPLETENHTPANFDLSDGSDSESENELATSPRKQDLFSTNPEPTNVESAQKVDSRKSRIELDDLIKKESSSNEFESQAEDLHTGNGLNFGTLTGGLRNKGGPPLRYPPPYTKAAAADASPSSKRSPDESSSIPVAPISRSFDSRASRLENKKPSVSMSSSESDSDDPSDKFPPQSTATQKTNKQTKITSRFSHPVAFFDDASDSEEDIPVPKQTFNNRVHLGSGLSRRTKGPPSAPYSKGDTEPMVVKAKDTNRESPAEPRSYTRKFKNEDHKQNREPPTSKREESPPDSRVFEPDPEAPESGKTKPSSSDTVKKPSHVHPKLPDYDSLAARLGSIRANHQ